MQRSNGLLWVVAGVCLSMVLAVSAGPTTGPRVSLEPGMENGGTITLYIPQEANTASRHIYLSGLTGSDLAALKFTCNLQPVPGLRATPPNVAVTWPGGQPAATIKADEWVTATLNVSNATALGRFDGSLVAERNGEALPVALLTVEHEPAPALHILGAKPSGALALTAYDPEFQFTFQVASENIASVHDLHVAASPFLGPNAVQVSSTLTKSGASVPQQLEVPGLGNVELTLSGKLQSVGTYSTEILLAYAGRSASTTVTVTRSNRPLTVEILGLQPVQHDKWPGGSDINFQFQLHETGNQKLEISKPLIIGLAIKRSAQFQSQANSKGQVLRVGSPAMQEVTDKLTLEPGQYQSYLLTVKDVHDVGEMTGMLVLGQGAAAPVQQSVSASLRYTWLVAAFFIALGIGASIVVRWINQKAQPRLAAQRRLSRAMQELRYLSTSPGDLKPGERLIQGALFARVAQVYQDVESQRSKPMDIDAFFREMDEKLKVFVAWANDRRRVEALQPPSLRSQFRSLLDAAQDYLRTPGTSTEQYTAISAQLNSMPRDIMKAMRDSLDSALKSFDQALSASRRSARLTVDINQHVRPVLAAANISYQRDDLVTTAAQLAQAKTAYAQALIDDFNRSIPVDAQPGMSARWTELIQELRQLLQSVRERASADPDSAIDQYHDAYLRYYAELTDALAGEINGKTQFEAAAQKIAALRQAMGTKSFDAICSLYNDALTAYELVVRPARPELQAGPTPPERKPDWGQSSDPVPRQEPFELAPEPNLEELECNLALLANSIIGLVAIASGLALLWINNLSWGSYGDILVALLWGLGLHQVGNATFDISSFADRLRGNKPQ